MRVENNTSVYIAQQKKAFAETGKFDEIYSAMKLARSTENHVKLDTPLVGTGNFERFELGENGLPIGMVRWEDLPSVTVSEMKGSPGWPPEATNPESIYEVPVDDWSELTRAARCVCEGIA